MQNLVARGNLELGRDLLSYLKFARNIGEGIKKGITTLNSKGTIKPVFLHTQRFIQIDSHFILRGNLICWLRRLVLISCIIMRDGRLPAAVNP